MYSSELFKNTGYGRFFSLRTKQYAATLPMPSQSSTRNEYNGILNLLTQYVPSTKRTSGNRLKHIFISPVTIINESSSCVSLSVTDMDDSGSSVP